MKKQIINLENWHRKEHFDFFKNYSDPFYGFTVNVHCSKAYHICKEQDHNFFLYYMHKILFAINNVENLKYRIEEDTVVLFDRINISPTIARKDHSFGFSYIEYQSDFEIFQEIGKKEIKRINDMSGLCISENEARLDVIHFSAIPWFTFSSVSHARQLGNGDSIPKISVGKTFTSNKSLLMPISIHVHHALVDGYHLSQFFDILNDVMN